jgi:hypothetical protein
LNGFKKLQENPVNMDFDKLRQLEGLQKDVFYLGICVLIIGFTAAAHNLYTPDDAVRVGYVEVETECFGVNAGGMCMGIQRQDQTTYNYADYNETEPGTENFYRRVESELMARAYNICTAEMEGMEWTDQAEYRNKTATEWLENENVQLLPCEKTFFRNVTAAK